MAKKSKKSKGATTPPQKGEPQQGHEALPLLTNPQVDDLFYRFSLPIMRPCITAHQQASSIGIAKILWLRLISKTDTEEQIGEDLCGIVHDRLEDNVALRSLYFCKMKAALSEAEIQQLQYYYSFAVHFIPLRTWEPSLKPYRLH